ncbi:MAG: hypothetical protein FH749_08685, partial [Firmicutes bacterium]|nr:hypothetical protein [Bacillota bacterium]
VDPFGLSPEFSSASIYGNLFARLGGLFLGGGVTGTQSSGDGFFSRLYSKITSVPVIGRGIKWGVEKVGSAANWVSELSPATKIIIGTVAIATATVATVLTGGAAAPVLASAIKVATISGVANSVVPTVLGGISGYIDGGWQGAFERAKQGFVEGFSTGFMAGGVGFAVNKTVQLVKGAAQTRQAAALARQSSGSCFVGGTLILTKDGHKPIEEIQVGDEVYSYNPETGEKGLKSVVNTFVHDKDVLLNVYIGELKIETTEEHPFWVVDKGWVLAGDLEVGDQLLLHSDEIVEITELEWIQLADPVKVYNFEVKDWHTYFVSEIDVFVHNKALRHGGTPQGSIDYGTLDHLGRPTGVRARITQDMIGTGSQASRSIRPPGFGGRAKTHSRGHLLGRQLGGAGNDPRNLVTLYQNPVNTPVMSGYERMIRTAVEGGEVINYNVVPIYHGSNLVPRSVTITAQGDKGFNLALSILNRQ